MSDTDDREDDLHGRDDGDLNGTQLHEEQNDQRAGAVTQSDDEQDNDDDDEEEEEEEEVYEMVEVDEDETEDGQAEVAEEPALLKRNIQEPSTRVMSTESPQVSQPDEADSFENVSMGTTPTQKASSAPGQQTASADPLAAFGNLKLEEAAAQVQGLAWEQLSKLGAAFATANSASDDDATGTSAAAGLGGVAGGVGLASFAKDLTSWWSNLDKPAEQQRSAAVEQVAKATAAGDALQQLFGLPPTENLVEEFKCKLSQTYACNHNAFTPAIQMAFAGTMSITDKHTCFTIEERGRKLPFKIAHADVTASVHDAAGKKGGGAGVLKISVGEGVRVEFKDFANPGDLESALALIEHLTESCKSAS